MALYYRCGVIAEKQYMDGAIVDEELRGNESGKQRVARDVAKLAPFPIGGPYHPYKRPRPCPGRRERKIGPPGAVLIKIL